MTAHTGVTVLLTGLPSSGKSSIAWATRAELVKKGRPAEVLDGDLIRRALWPELGMSRADREQNLTRIGTVARLLSRNGVVAVVAAIAPYAAARQAMRAQHQDEGVAFAEVHVATPVAVCRQRDVKGLYAQQARGEITGLTGVDAVYEVPDFPSLRIDTSTEAVERSAGRVVELVLGGRAQRAATDTAQLGSANSHSLPWVIDERRS